MHLYYDRSGCKHSYPVGRLTAISDATGSTDYCYDARGNVTAKWQVTPAGTFITYYSWNPADRLQGIGYPDGASVTYRRDANGRVASVSARPVGGMATTVLEGIGYLPFGPATQYSFAQGGQVLDKTYDANYRATDIGSPWLNLHFQRDALGNLVAEGNAPGVPTPNETYRYDPLDRLQQVDAPNGAPWWTYTYDKTGDRMSKVIAGAGTDSYHYQPGTHHLAGISGAEVSQRAFDANGNTTALQAHGWTYGLGYDATNRLTVVQQNGTTVATYGVNGIGERVTKTLAGGATHTYVHDEGGKLLEEYAPGQARDYVWAGDTLVAILDNPAQGGDTIHYVYTDALGSPRAVTTRANKLVWDWPYRQNPFGEAPASGNGYTLNLRFPGQYHDQEDGLDYNVFRDYEPTTGRYIESDPIGLIGGVSTYAYVVDDPMDSADMDAQRGHGKRPPMTPPNSGDGEPMPGAWPTSNGDISYIEVCVRGMCPTDPHECHKGTPSMHPIYFTGNPPTMYPMMNGFQQAYPGCICTKTMWADQTIQPDEPPANKYDYMDLFNKMIESRNPL